MLAARSATRASSSSVAGCTSTSSSSAARRVVTLPKASSVARNNNSKSATRSGARINSSRPISAAAAAAAVDAQTTAPAPPPILPFRVGHGFDLHRLEEGEDLELILGGIKIPHDRGCVAHSDGDALLHTVTDAILGALGRPDIGQLFPDNDPKWKGQTSDVFVKEAVRLMREAGYSLGNLDCTIILQRPKLSPHKPAIVANLCKILEAHPSVVNVKAKTHEKVDSMGEGRSVAVHAVVLLVKD